MYADRAALDADVKTAVVQLINGFLADGVDPAPIVGSLRRNFKALL